MPKSLKTYKLAHEISFAVFRVSALVVHDRLRKELEGAAIGLVRDLTLKAIDTLLRLVWLAEAVEEINEINARVLMRELGNFRKIILKDKKNLITYLGIAESLAEFEEEPDEGVNLEDYFGKTSVMARDQGLNIPAHRREAIRQFIRQFPDGCRMRDLSSKFTEFSERTIRNDVQDLVSRGLVEKIGSKSGPFSYLRETAVVAPIVTLASDLTDSSNQ